MLGTVLKESVILFSFSFSPILKSIVFLCIFTYSDAQHFAVLLSLVFCVVLVCFVCLRSLSCTKCCQFFWIVHTGTCFIQKIYAPSSSLLQGKHLSFTLSPLRLNIFRLFVILSLTQLYRYTPEIFLFSTGTFKYTYRAPLRRIGQEYAAKDVLVILRNRFSFGYQ